MLETLRTALDGQYTIDRELGRGAMGVVYLAIPEGSDHAVAIKVVRPELSAQMGHERFLREAEIAKQLQHPNILSVIDSGAAEPFLYCVMPFVQGETLREILTDEPQLPWQEGVEVATAVAEGLTFAHEQGFVHRDIKPENVFVADQGVLVMDFGLARAIDRSAHASLTQTGAALGTLAYMSPEQAMGASEVDGRTDQYALGCMLFEMLAGQLPFTAPNATGVISQHLKAPPPRVDTFCPNAPGTVVAAIQRAMAKTPEERYPTAREFARALTEGDAPAAESPKKAGGGLFGWLKGG